MMARRTLVLAAFLVSAAAMAAEPGAREQKIAQIIEAQGLHQMFQAQLDQGLVSARETGQKVVQRLAQEAGASGPEASRKLEPIFRRYMERCATMFSARELVDVWSQDYGRGLSDAELDQILAFYRSSAGKKDVAASHAAMAAFAQKTASLGQARLDASLGQLMQELREAFRK